MILYLLDFSSYSFQHKHLSLGFVLLKKLGFAPILNISCGDADTSSLCRPAFHDSGNENSVDDGLFPND